MSAHIEMEQPLSVRDFLNRYKLPQLVRIHEAHLQQLNETRRPPARSHIRDQSRGSNEDRTSPLETRFGSKLNQQLNSTGQSSTLESNDSGNASSCSSSQPSAGGQTSPASNDRWNEINNSGQTSPTEPSSENSSPDQQQQLLDLDQPFLLYKAYSCRQVIAHTLDVSSEADVNRFNRVGPALLIPESYTGKFDLIYIQI